MLRAKDMPQGMIEVNPNLEIVVGSVKDFWDNLKAEVEWERDVCGREVCSP